MENQEKTTGSSSPRKAFIYLRTSFDGALAMCGASRTIDVLVCTQPDRLPPDCGELLELVARGEAAGVRVEILDTRPLRLRLHKQPAPDARKAGSQARRSRRRKSSNSQKGPISSGPQANLPLFEE